jgi:hypothetical protein
LALLISVSLDPFSSPGEICGEAALAAIDLVRISMGNAESFAASMGQGSDWIRCQRSVADFVASKGHAGITYRELSRLCWPFRNLAGRREKMKLLDDLAESGEIEMRTIKKYQHTSILISIPSTDD